MPGSFQTHFPALRPINQGYICVGWTSTPRGGGGAETFMFLSVCTHILCFYARVCMLPVRALDGSEVGFVCSVTICRQRQEEFVDAGLIPDLQPKLPPLTTSSGALSSSCPY